MRTYTQGMGVTVTGDEEPDLEIADLTKLIDQDTALFIVQTPNFFGQIEDLGGLAQAVHRAGGLLCVVCDPISLGLLKPPGQYGADIVVGEGQPLGVPLSYGGPYLGFFATRKEYVRRMAGRLVGAARDSQGRPGYVLTLATREQHIKRERATSNICTNSGLMSIAAAVHLATLGKHGLRRVAELCYHKAHYAAAEIGRLPGYHGPGQKPFFREFVVQCPAPVAEINARLFDDYQIIGGYDLGREYGHLDGHMLLSVTEMNSREQIDELVEALASVSEEASP
jgi:glycine dehydrogenase subunit 1